jgi:NAD-dependent SIR2 family protein deacetylase
MECESHEKIAEAAELIRDSKRITVFTGAGISTNCGIPDFRSENGLYNLVKQKYRLPYPEAIFDIAYFRRNPEAFFNLTKELASDTIKPSISHEFIAWLEERGKVALVVTQNIDMLHSKAGSKNVIECHGSSLTGTCMKCKKKFDQAEFEPDIRDDKIPLCSCGGVIKPDVVFFGEKLPDSFYVAYQSPPETDLLIVMGTSLTVEPAASFALRIAGTTRSIMVNRDPTQYDGLFSLVFHMDTDSWSTGIRTLIDKGKA